MSEQDTPPVDDGDDVEAHGIKEVIATGAAAGALLAGAQVANAAVAPGDGGSAAGKAAPRAAADPGGGGASGARFVLPDPGGAGGQVAPGDGSSSAGKANAKKAKKKVGRK